MTWLFLQTHKIQKALNKMITGYTSQIKYKKALPSALGCRQIPCPLTPINPHPLNPRINPTSAIRAPNLETTLAATRVRVQRCGPSPCALHLCMHSPNAKRPVGNSPTESGCCGLDRVCPPLSHSSPVCPNSSFLPAQIRSQTISLVMPFY